MFFEDWPDRIFVRRLSRGLSRDGAELEDLERSEHEVSRYECSRGIP
jgi:hypothetical protein